MSACGREFHVARMRSKMSSIEAAGCGSLARCRPTESHTCSIGDISGELAGQGRRCLCWVKQKSRTVFEMCGRALFC
ncbi:uncharacterized protein TNCV_511951 [Trichonephila clavipes]|nr:uncharacterized protein TNCV_511951 [Trichonephila clavipes]